MFNDGPLTKTFFHYYEQGNEELKTTRQLCVVY